MDTTDINSQFAEVAKELRDVALVLRIVIGIVEVRTKGLITRAELADILEQVFDLADKEDRGLWLPLLIESLHQDVARGDRPAGWPEWLRGVVNGGAEAG